MRRSSGASAPRGIPSGLDSGFSQLHPMRWEAPMDRGYVGIDFHRRRSVIVRVSATGEKLSTTRVANDPLAIAAAVAEAGPNPEVVVEATYGWYWVVDLLQAGGARVHLANPQGLNLGAAPGEERRARRRRLGRHAAPGSAAGGVDRPAGRAGVAGAGALPGQARGSALGT